MGPEASKELTPPALAALLLAAAVGGEDRPYLLEDADAAFRRIAEEAGVRAARRWYWRQALTSLVPLLGARWTGRVRRRGRPIARLGGDAARAVRRHPAFAAAVIGTLALGVTAAVTVYSVVDAVVLRPLPYPQPQSLIAVTSYDRVRGLPDRDLSGPDYFDLRAGTRVFEDLAAFEIAPQTLSTAEGAVRIEAARVTPVLFALLGISPLAGRTFANGEVGPGAPRLAILSEALAFQQGGGAQTALGRVVVLDGEAYTVVGVIRPRPPLPVMDVDVWLPLPYDAASLRRQAGVLGVIGRLAGGISLTAAAADVARIGSALEEDHPESNLGRSFAVTPLHVQLTAGVRPVLAVLVLAVALLLGIAGVNAAALLLVRYLRRERELAIRTALGASRYELVKQLLGEGLLLGGAAGVVSAGVVSVLLPVIAPLLPLGTVARDGLAVGGATFGVAVSLAIAAALLATGIAVWSVRPGGLNGRGTAGVGARRTRSWLLGGQLAAATVLVVCVALLGQSLVRLVRVDPGFEPRGLVSLEVTLPEARYPTDIRSYPEWPEIQAFYGRMLGEVEGLPGVDQAALGWFHPMRPGWLTRFVREGAEAVPEGERDMVNIRGVSPGYLDVVGARLLEGRDILAADREEGEPVVLVNRTLARRYFPEGDAVGQRLLVFGDWWRIVGIVDDFRSRGLGLEPHPAVFPPLRQMPSEVIHLLVRGHGSPEKLLAEIRDAVWRVDSELAADDLVSLERLLAESTAQRRFVLRLFGAFGALAFLLALAGTAAAVAESVESRRRELGIRRALGSSAAGLYRLVLGHSVRWSAIAVAIGLVMAIPVTRILEPWLFQVSGAAPEAYALTAGILLGGAALASAIPATRALTCDPTAALRGGVD